MRAKLREAARHCFIVAEDTIAMQFHPIGEAAADVIERKRPENVARQLNALPGGQVVVNLPARFPELVFHRFDLGIEIELVLVRMVFQVLEPPLQLQDRFFKIKRMGFHSVERLRN